MEHFIPSHSLFILKLKQSNSFKPVKLIIGGHYVMTRSTEQITEVSWFLLQVNVVTLVNKVQKACMVYNSTRHDINRNNYNNVSMSKYAAQVQQH